MNREIKFRGYNEGWHYGHYIKQARSLINGTTPISLGECQIVSFIVYSEAEKLHIIEVHDDSVEQYTGLKDKNGVEIYCGDIVKVYYEDVIGDCEPIQRAYAFDWAGKIVYLQEDAMFAIVDKDEVFIDTLESEVGKSLIFLGNIHQHPELLNS